MKRSLFKKELKIPYKDRDKTRTYLGFYGFCTGEVKNYIFQDTLLFTGFSRGRSSVKVHFKSEITHSEYEMFLKDYELILLNTSQEPRQIVGEFCFRKAGQNYGIVLIDEEE